uniref:Surfeit locus protein 4 n=1 Tax=Macrostomum lignano TaxID=282301 RepID=A0A1I8GB40_9PLAT
VLRRSKHLIPTVARLCLISTYLEDGIRMWVQWSDQAEYIQHQWNAPAVAGHSFVIANMLLQLAGCAMVLLRCRVEIACAMLASVLLLQSVAYQILWESNFLLRNLAIGGGVLLLFVESRVEARSLFAGLPSTGEGGRHRRWLLLSGRLLVLLMLATLARFDTAVYMLNFGIDLLLVLLIAVGYKTKLCALAASLKLLIINLIANPWWSLAATSTRRDVMRFDFFQTMSVIGGLLLVVAVGPGGVSLDERKKRF